ncbi:hypothetical protein D1AOALGA4SA_3281 [Olavius algarvensis Delta 1 endosymbiont]|nr:hypothetical protein D1AOALGA4SA_3281 [Olavius algarvensis Delta 1 endosymbiont]
MFCKAKIILTKLIDYFSMASPRRRASGVAAGFVPARSLVKSKRFSVIDPILVE